MLRERERGISITVLRQHVTTEHLILEATDTLVTLSYISGGGILPPSMVSFIVTSKKTDTKRCTAEMASPFCAGSLGSSPIRCSVTFC